MSKVIVGITGKSGSGKTTLTNELVKNIHNSKAINIDSIRHQVLAFPNIIKKICEVFGRDILNKDGNINRKKLGNIVFANNEKMLQLTLIISPYISNEIEQEIKSNYDVIILDGILLPQITVWKNCNIKILVCEDLPIRRNRVIIRDNISKEYFDAREKTSIEYEEDQFDYIIFNNSYKALLTTVEELTNIINS